MDDKGGDGKVRAGKLQGDKLQEGRPRGDKGGIAPRPLRVRMARAGFSELVLVCAKCAKRQGLKKGAVRRRLRRELKGRPLSGKPRVVEVGCLGPCPKRSLAIATAESLAKQRIHLIDPAATPAQAIDALFPDFGPKGVLPRA